MSSYRQRKKSGFADTKEYPHRNHPANYRKLDRDNIEYVTFTHHPVVSVNGKDYKTVPLNDNIDINVQKMNKHREIKEISFVYPKVYVGKRSALKNEITNCSLTSEDKLLIDFLFKTLPKEKITYTSSSWPRKK